MIGTEIRIRRATANDTSAMLSITRNVWNGTDYLPSVWHDWLHDVSGYLMVAEWQGRVVGLQHVALQEGKTAWLEGIRVAEEVRGLQVGGALLAHALRWAQDSGCTVARMSTSGSNPASQRLAARAGMRAIDTFRPLKARIDLPPEVPGSPRIARVTDAPWVLDHLRNGSVGLRAGFYTEGWTAYQVSLERIRLLCASNSVALIEVGDALRGVLIVTCAAPFRYARMGAITGDALAVRDLAGFALHQVFQMGMRHVRATVGVSGERLTALESVGFDASTDFEMFLHEIQLDSL